MNRLRFFAFVIVVLSPVLALANDAVWGDLVGRFSYDGDPPPRKTFRVTNDTAEFGDTIRDESLIVNEKNRGIANVVVYLLPNDDGEIPVHPSYIGTEDATVELAMQNGRFEPHVLLLRTTQTLIQRNKDDVAYSANVLFLRDGPMSPHLSPSDSVELQHTKEEPMPAAVVCNIHPWMRAFLLVRANPYMAKTDPDGRFTIKNVPVGQHVFRVWHERTGFLRNVRVGSLTTDVSGRVTVTIRQGMNELEPVRLSPSLFARDD